MATAVYCMQAFLEAENDAAPVAGQHAEHEGWHQAASLLGRKHDRVDPVQALPLLPSQVSHDPLHVVWSQTREDKLPHNHARQICCLVIVVLQGCRSRIHQVG